MAIKLQTDAEAGESLLVAHYVGEKFPMVFECYGHSGDALDLNDATEITLEMKDDDGEVVIEKVTDDFTAPYDGRVNHARVLIEPDDASDPGRLRGQVSVTTDESVVKSPPLTLILMSGEAAVTISDMRYTLQDLESQHDFIKGREFRDDLLAYARYLAVEDWNSQSGKFTSHTVESIPGDWSGAFLKGAIGHALVMKGQNLGANTVQASAGGVDFDDKSNRTKMYLEIGNQFRAEWLKTVKGKQHQETIKDSFRTIHRHRRFR